MNLILPIAVGGAVYLLAKGGKVPESGAGPHDVAADPRATLSGPDGAQVDKGGAALSAFPAVGTGSASGSTQTAAIPRPPPAVGTGTTGRTTGNQGRKSHTFQAAKPLRRDCGSCRDTQVAVQAAVGGLAPGMIF